MAKVQLAEYDNVVEAVPSDRADQPFRMSVLPWRSWGGWPIPNAHCPKTPDEDVAINAVPIWLSRNGRPLDYSSLYHLVCKRTREAFGKQINPHLFRSCLATSTAVHHGAEMGLAMTVLGHQSFKVTERHYN